MKFPGIKLSGWGRYPRIQADGYTFETVAEAAGLLSMKNKWIAHGLGKSYGDSALNEHVLLTGRFDKLLDFDEEQGIVRCESGVTLAELIEIFLPRGWFLKVTPGTRLITVGGAIASDVHGKNHHVDGCFSTSVLSFRLMLPNGEILNCSRDQNPDLFRATCGGMGLTGLVIDATLKMRRVDSALISEKIIRCRNLDEIFEQFEIHKHTLYSVAWVDCLAGGNELGRSLLMTGEHADDGLLSIQNSKKRRSIPFEFPSFLLNAYSVKLFNNIYYSVKGRHQPEHKVPLDKFFYPLDQIDSWNLIYGPSGFTQYQIVLPEASSLEGLRIILQKIGRAKQGSFLAVLKLFGPQNENPLSFPMQGYTLALDFKIQHGLFQILDELDSIVLDHGGRHYLAKDVRLKAEVFQPGYPGLSQFQKLRQQYGLTEKFSSLQSRRLGI